MADNNKAVGSLAAAKLVTLIKAETGKKYDRTGGKIDGSAEITGGLKVGMSSEFSSSIKAESEISSDMLLMAPIVALYDPAKEESVSFGVSGENAAKVTSPVSGGGVQYARLAVGTPTGDNDAATKAYVDAAAGATVYVDFWPTSSDVEYIETFKAYVADLAASQTFDSVFDLVNTGNTVVARLYDNSNKANLVAESIETGISGDKELGNINFLFMNAATGTPFGIPTISDAIWLTKTNNNTVAYALYRYCPLPLPASDNSDTGKVPTINGKKWELKKPESTTTVDDAMSNTSTNAVQNKVIKKYVDDIAGKKLNQTEPLIKEGLTIENTLNFAIWAQPDSLTSATGEDFVTLAFSDSSPQSGDNGVVLSGLANFGDAEAAGLENTAVSYAQLVEYTKPLLLTYDNNQVIGASYTEIRKAIERGRQIKLAVANTIDIIASNARNETNKSVLMFTNTGVDDGTVSISQYTVTAQASGLTCNVKSHELRIKK